MTQRWLASALILLTMFAALTACSTPRDMSYLESRERPPLIIPEGLSAPPYSQAMEIPRPAEGAQAPVDAQAAEALEQPPRRVGVTP
ncbi:MAG: hypothetical protein LBV36_03515 [Chromatiales bacterium]|jgi:uncharacterized lipoprotein|nr:hypothetical protein [Chromatiales bacterium]